MTSRVTSRQQRPTQPPKQAPLVPRQASAIARSRHGFHCQVQTSPKPETAKSVAVPAFLPACLSMCFFVCLPHPRAHCRSRVGGAPMAQGSDGGPWAGQLLRAMGGFNVGRNINNE